MQCDQIRMYLDDYVAGRLPKFKAAWVAQHLAGCVECQESVQQRAPVARPAAAGRQVRPEPPAVIAGGQGPESVPVQRPVPAWLRQGARLFLLAVVVCTIWLLARGLSRPAERPKVGELPAQAAWTGLT